MPKDRFELCLQPSCDGYSTHLQLCGSVLNSTPPSELEQWLRLLSSWTDVPVELALPAGEATGEWFESWTDAITELPAHHLKLRFTLEPHGDRDAA